MKKLIEILLYLIDLAPMRCMVCKKILGFKFHLRPRSVGAESHGICKRCAVKFESNYDEYRKSVPSVVQSNDICSECGAALDGSERHATDCSAFIKSRRQTPLRKTLRHRTGGWSGAVALRGRVSH